MGVNSLAAVVALAVLFISASINLAEANCKVKNDSGKKVIIIPVEVDITIEVDVGAVVEIPPPQQKCSFKNPETGHKSEPVTLKDGSTYVCKEGFVKGTIDVYLGVYVLGILQLSAQIIIGL